MTVVERLAKSVGEDPITSSLVGRSGAYALPNGLGLGVWLGGGGGRGGWVMGNGH